MINNKNNKSSEVGALSNGMKVLMFSTDDNIFVAGSEVRRRMLDYGKSWGELYVIIYSRRPRGEDRLGEKIFAYSTGSVFKPTYFFTAYNLARKIIEKAGFSVEDSLVTSQDPFETGLLAYLVKKNFSLPWQVQIHTDIFSPYFWKESVKNKIRVFLAKWLIPKADRIRVVSVRIKQSIIRSFRYPESKIEVRPIVVDIEKIKNAPIRTNLREKYPNYNFIILMASRLTREKNIGFAIEAMAEIVRKYPKAMLLIAGDGPELEKLKLKSEKLKITENVEFEPATDDLISYYKTADLFLLTSYYEGYGRTAVEASAAGLPVVMTDVGVAIGRLVEVGNKDQLVEVLDDMIKKKR